VVFDLKSSVYYGLDTVGARIWNLIQVPRAVNEIRDILLKFGYKLSHVL
jgi:Coenzyme PQQ synthesis protein D (PqqD)